MKLLRDKKPSDCAPQPLGQFNQGDKISLLAAEVDGPVTNGEAVVGG
jgi:hypothetical protein